MLKVWFKPYDDYENIEVCLPFTLLQGLTTIATLDNMFPGRFQLGVGTGEPYDSDN